MFIAMTQWHIVQSVRRVRVLAGQYACCVNKLLENAGLQTWLSRQIVTSQTAFVQLQCPTCVTAQCYNVVGRHTIKELPRASPHLCTPLARRLIRSSWLWSRSCPWLRLSWNTFLPWHINFGPLDPIWTNISGSRHISNDKKSIHLFLHMRRILASVKLPLHSRDKFINNLKKVSKLLHIRKRIFFFIDLWTHVNAPNKRLSHPKKLIAGIPNSFFE